MRVQLIGGNGDEYTEEEDRLLGWMIRALLTAAEAPPREVKGVSNEFLDGELREEGKGVKGDNCGYGDMGKGTSFLLSSPFFLHLSLNPLPKNSPNPKKPHY